MGPRNIPQKEKLEKSHKEKSKATPPLLTSLPPTTNICSERTPADPLGQQAREYRKESVEE
jgi:hypothetical protein